MNMNIVKNITKITWNIFSILFIFVLIPVVFFTLLTSRTSAFLGIRSFTVLTGSMTPRIPVGSIVFTKPSTYDIGDIITFKRGDKSITHRIFGIKNGQYQTKGDANSSADPQMVNKSDIIGKDLVIVPYIGKFGGFIKTIPGFTMFIAIPTLVFVGLEIWEIKKEMEKEIEKKLLAKMKHGEQGTQVSVI